MLEDPTKKEVYVTELASPDDRWVSVTDASRIGRRQEHTIRTWIAQGLLPVNPVRVGINKKTRQVRLSDLAKLTPIIDPEAGIATDLGTLDLPSIPKQQQQVMDQMTMLQQEVTSELATLGGRLRELADKHELLAGEARQMWLVYQQQYQQLAHRDDEQQEQLQQVRDRLVEQATSYSQRLQQAREDLTALVVQTEQALRQALEAVRKTSEEETEQVRKHVARLEAAIWAAHNELVEAVGRLEAHTAQQFAQETRRFESFEVTLGELQGEIRKQGEQVSWLEKELLTQATQLTKQVELLAQVSQLAKQLTTQLAGLESTWQELAETAEQEVRQLRRDLETQGRLQQTLQQQLDEERQAREALTRQVDKLLKLGQQKGKGQE